MQLQENWREAPVSPGPRRGGPQGPPRTARPQPACAAARRLSLREGAYPTFPWNVRHASRRGGHSAPGSRPSRPGQRVAYPPCRRCHRPLHNFETLSTSSPPLGLAWRGVIAECRKKVKRDVFSYFVFPVPHLRSNGGRRCLGWSIGRWMAHSRLRGARIFTSASLRVSSWPDLIRPSLFVAREQMPGSSPGMTGVGVVVGWCTWRAWRLGWTIGCWMSHCGLRCARIFQNVSLRVSSWPDLIRPSFCRCREDARIKSGHGERGRGWVGALCNRRHT